MQQPYSSDLTASQWQAIEKLICVKRKSIWPLQRIVEAIFYLTKNGIIWRDLPEGYGAPQKLDRKNNLKQLILQLRNVQQ